MSLHIKNGTLHIPGGAELGDILTNGGIIEAIGPVKCPPCQDMIFENIV